MRWQRGSFAQRMWVLNRYLGYGIHVVKKSEKEWPAPPSFLVLRLDLSSDEYHPVMCGSFSFKAAAVLPCLRPFTALGTHVDARGNVFLKELARMAMYATSPEPVNLEEFVVQEVSHGFKVVTKRSPLGAPRASLLITHDWDMMWVDKDGGHPIQQQAMCHEYLLENLFAVDLAADEFFPLV